VVSGALLAMQNYCLPLWSSLALNLVPFREVMAAEVPGPEKRKEGRWACEEIGILGCF